MNWANGFSFGPLSGVQQGLFEDKPDLAYQKLTDWFGQTPGFDNSVFARWLKSQQSNYYNRFVNEQAQNPTGGLTWTKYLERQAPNLQGDFQALPGYLRGSAPGQQRVRRELW